MRRAPSTCTYELQAARGSERDVRCSHPVRSTGRRKCTTGSDALRARAMNSFFCQRRVPWANVATMVIRDRKYDAVLTWQSPSRPRRIARSSSSTRACPGRRASRPRRPARASSHRRRLHDRRRRAKPLTEGRQLEARGHGTLVHWYHAATAPRDPKGERSIRGEGTIPSTASRGTGSAPGIVPDSGAAAVGRPERADLATCRGFAWQCVSVGETLTHECVAGIALP
jgi:hypothetical protein